MNKWQNEQTVLFRERSEHNNAKFHLYRWLIRVRQEKETKDRNNAASDFYDIKILVT